MSKNKTRSPPSPKMNRTQDEPASMASSSALDDKSRGYPLTIFNGKADEKFCCSYCKYILRNPVQSSCGHRFCQECVRLMETLPRPSQQCKSCVEEGITDEDSFLNFTEVFEDKAARREMKKLQVKCMYQCTWRGPFNDFMVHEENCDKKMVRCISCSATVSKARLTNHQEKSCPKRIIPCEYCQEKITYEFKEKHNGECQKFRIKCENCKIQVERYKMLQHQETVCVNRQIICPVPECDTQLPFDKFLAHVCKDESTAKHLTYLLDRSEVVEQRLKTLEARLPCTGSGFQAGHSSFSASSSAVGGDLAQASAGLPPDSSPGPEGMQGEGAQAEDGSGGLIPDDRQKLKLHEDLMAVLHSEILRCITKGEALGRGMEKFDNRLRDCYAKIEALSAQAKSVPRGPEYGELLAEGPGAFNWVIKQFGQVKQDAAQREREMICSPTFESCPGGYNLRLKLYPNGEGEDNRGKNMSLYLQIVKGPCDDLLLWPFSPKVHFMLVDQVNFQQHRIKTYEFDPMSPSSRQPMEEVNMGAGCPGFISIREMETKRTMFWPRDTVYLKFLIEMPKVNMDRLNALNPLTYTSASVRS